MKKLLLFLLISPFFMFSQNPGYELIKKINGVDVYYKITKTKEGDKKDTWIIEFEYFNTTGKDIFYKAVIEKPDGMDELFGDKKDKVFFDFASISLENAKKMSFISDSSAKLSGDKTRLNTDKGENIYLIKKGKTYTKTMNFRAEKGIEPVIAIQTINSISFTENIYDFL